MSVDYVRQRRLRLLQTVVLAGVMVYLAARAAAVVMGPMGAALALLLVAVVSMYSVTNQRVLFPMGTHLLRWSDAPGLYRQVQELAHRAGLDAAPALYVVPTREPVALTTGVGSGAVLVVSRGLLSILNERELRAVLAHELAHMRNHDLPLFALMGAMQRITRMVAGLLMMVVVFAFPLMLIGIAILPAEALLYLALVPLVSLFAQMALLRTREFQADLGAAEITGDPAALASALQRIERSRQPLWNVFIPTPGRAGRLAELLRTHPTTDERIQHLRALML